MKVNRRILFEIAHPKHFHQFKPLIESLSTNSEMRIIARDKDVVLELLEQARLSYEMYGSHGKSMFQKLQILPAIIGKYFKIVKEFKPDLVISRSSPYAALVCKVFKTKTLIFPDSEVVSFNHRFVVPLSDYIITPLTYGINYGVNHFRVNGLFESAYLHPCYFKPDEGVLQSLNLNVNDPFFIIRFVGWNANHDIDRKGFTDTQKVKLVRYLEDKGRVLISSEGNLSAELNPYQIRIHPSKMHSLLSYASLYIGDSQTMATEAALLGTPAIRYNSFVGENDMSNFQLLEKKYNLLINLSNFDRVLSKTKEILDQPNYKVNLNQRKNKYYSDVGDVNKESIKFIENILRTI